MRQNIIGTGMLLVMLPVFLKAQDVRTDLAKNVQDWSIAEGVPAPFSFNDYFDAQPSQEILSDEITITGISGPTAVSISNGAYSINDGDFYSASGTVENQDKIRIRLLASANWGGVNSSLLTVGTQSADFNVRTVDDPQSGWSQVPEILSRINPPRFPDRDFKVTDFGAVGDGSTLCTDAFRQAISACSDSGGGRVVVPEGTFLSGAIHLKSNVNLYLKKNALIRFSQNLSDFLPVVYTRFEGTECYNYSPPVYAFEQQNIAITGQGTLDGRGDASHWWNWKSTGGSDVNNLRQQAEDGVPVAERIYGEGHFIRPNMIQPYRCTNVLIDSVTILNGPMWHVHPVLCENVTISNITVKGHGPNNDGCNPESCRDILIKNCFFDTGDDCIAIKSGRNADGRRVNKPSENIIIRNCIMNDGHGGVVIGSEMSGSARNIFAEDCFMDSPNLERALRIKTNSMRGGVVENVYLRNITVGQVADAVLRINFYYGEGDIGEFTPTVHNVEIQNLVCQQTNYALRLQGYARSPISNIRFINCTVNNTNAANVVSNVQNLALDSTTIEDVIYHKILNPLSDVPLGIQTKEHISKPLKSILVENYPNPFNPVTNIEYRLTISDFVNLSVYNILGQKVATLVNKKQLAGSYQLQWDASGFPSGEYLYRLNTGDYIETKKMVLIK